MEMARALVAAHGPGYLRHSFTRPVGAVFRNYMMLTLTDPRVITFAPELPGCSKTYRPSGSGAFQERRPPRRIPAIRRPCYPPVLLTGLPRRHCLLHGMNERPVPGNRKRGVKVCSWVLQLWPPAERRSAHCAGRFRSGQSASGPHSVVILAGRADAGCQLLTVSAVRKIASERQESLTFRSSSSSTRRLRRADHSARINGRRREASRAARTSTCGSLLSHLCYRRLNRAERSSGYPQPALRQNPNSSFRNKKNKTFFVGNCPPLGWVCSFPITTTPFR